MDNYCVTFLAEKTASLEKVPFDNAPPAADELICKTIVSAVSSGSETGGYMNYLGTSHYPAVSGYAAVLEVMQAGAASGFAPGDMVFAQCPHQLYIRLPASEFISVPRDMAPEAAVLSRFPAISMTTMINTAIKPTEPVAVIGLGIVGLMAAQMFQHCGYTVYAVDPVETRRKTASMCGLKLVCASADEIAPEYCGLVVDCSGSDRAVMAALPCIRKGGELSLVGVPWRKTADIPVQELFRQIFYGYIHVYSGWEWSIPMRSQEFLPNSNFHSFTTAMEWLRSGALKIDGIYKVADPRDCNTLYQDIVNHRMAETCAIYDWRSFH